MNNQKKECGCVYNDLLVKMIEQNNNLIEQNNQLIQINNEQTSQINHLLEQIDFDDDRESSSRSLDGG